MFYYQLTCRPNPKEKTEMALAAPQGGPGPLVIAEPKIDDHQLWQMLGFTEVINNKGVFNTFYLVNKHTGRAAEAPHDANGNVAPDRQGVSQADIKNRYSPASMVRLWTIDFFGGAFAIRPLGDKGQNLNAWQKRAEPNVEVGIYKWQNGESNELWGLKPVEA